MSRPVVHFEIGCRDHGKTGEFYSKSFDWQTQENGPATMIGAGSGGIGGHLTSLGHEPYPYTMFYVQVDDIPASLDKAVTFGSKALVGPIDIPDGSFAWFADQNGNTIGLWNPKA